MAADHGVTVPGPYLSWCGKKTHVSLAKFSGVNCLLGMVTEEPSAVFYPSALSFVAS